MRTCSSYVHVSFYYNEYVKGSYSIHVASHVYQAGDVC